MPVCVHCGAANDALFTAYGPHHIVCTRCATCGDFVDPYIEQEAFIVALDLILVKPRAYRHLLFNYAEGAERLTKEPADVTGKKEASGAPNTGETSETNPSVWLRTARHFIALLLVDTYVRWFNDTEAVPINFDDRSEDVLSSTFRSYGSALYQTFIPLFLMHVIVVAVCSAYVAVVKRRATNAAQHSDGNDEVERFRLHHVTNALLLSSLCPLFLLSLLLLWQTTPVAESVQVNNISAWEWREDSIQWAIRTLVNGLSAGVAIGVVLPLQRTPLGSLTTLVALVAGWSAQLWISQLL